MIAVTLCPKIQRSGSHNSSHTLAIVSSAIRIASDKRDVKGREVNMIGRIASPEIPLIIKDNKNV